MSTNTSFYVSLSLVYLATQAVITLMIWFGVELTEYLSIKIMTIVFGAFILIFNTFRLFLAVKWHAICKVITKD